MDCAFCKKDINEKYYIELTWKVIKKDKEYMLPLKTKQNIFNQLASKVEIHKKCLAKVLGKVKGGK